MVCVGVCMDVGVLCCVSLCVVFCGVLLYMMWLCVSCDGMSCGVVRCCVV